MKRKMIVLITLAILPLLITGATAGQDLVETVANKWLSLAPKIFVHRTPANPNNWANHAIINLGI